MKMRPKNDRSDFPDLELASLSNYAEKWMSYLNHKYKIIEVKSVYLCRFDTKAQERIRAHFKAEWITTKYAIVFEHTGCEEVDPESVEFYPMEDYSDCQNFISEIKFAGDYGGNHPFIDDAFQRRVYRKECPADSSKEWIFITKGKKAKLSNVLTHKESPLIHLDTAYELFRYDQLPAVVLRIIHDVRPEIESLYDALKRVEGSLNIPKVEKWEKALLDEFDSNGEFYKIIRRDYLQKKDIYTLTPTNEKRAFVGRLLKSVLAEDKKFSRIAANKLWNAYKEMVQKPCS